MPKYINLEDPTVYVGGYTPDGHTVFHVPSNTPTADVRENVHGRWLKKVAFYLTCSNCYTAIIEPNEVESPFLFNDGKMNFCPNCGAVMDERREENGEIH